MYKRQGWIAFCALALVLAGCATHEAPKKDSAAAAAPGKAEAAKPEPKPKEESIRAESRLAESPVAASMPAPSSPSISLMDRSMPMAPPPPVLKQQAMLFSREPNTESYTETPANEFLTPKDAPLSTFSIDVDTASYSNVRRFLNDGQLPPPAAVRTEELINYFPYDLPNATGEHPFSVTTETAACPWKPEHQLLRIGLKGKTFDDRERPAANLVFLIDVSGSMQPPNKLPLLVQSLKLALGQLGEEDRVGIVVYAGSSGTALAPTHCDAHGKRKITAALDGLCAGGSTNGAGGIEEAYRLAGENFVKGGVNRVVLATDGDFNVGITDPNDLNKLIVEKAKSGVFLTVLGFGEGNLKDSTMEQLADKGNGNYAYIDGIREGRKVLVEQSGGTLVTIAKDVKIQVEFNPAEVAAYRLIGYENRLLAAKDFNDDKKDAGEIGAGHTVTALYEIVPVGQTIPGPSVDDLKYQRPEKLPDTDNLAPGELLTVKLRYKAPDGDTSKLLRTVVRRGDTRLDAASPDLRFAAATAAFAMLLTRNTNLGDYSYDQAIALAKSAKGPDPDNLRAECINLMKTARDLGGSAERARPMAIE